MSERPESWQDNALRRLIKVTSELQDGNNILALSDVAWLHGFLEGVILFGEKFPHLVADLPQGGSDR